MLACGVDKKNRPAVPGGLFELGGRASVVDVDEVDGRDSHSAAYARAGRRDFENSTEGAHA